MQNTIECAAYGEKGSYLARCTEGRLGFFSDKSLLDAQIGLERNLNRLRQTEGHDFPIDYWHKRSLKERLSIRWKMTVASVFSILKPIEYARWQYREI